MVSPITAGDPEAEHIDGILYGAVAELQAIHDDPVTPPQCRDYTDTLMTVLGLVDAIGERPDSAYLPQLLGAMLTAMAQSRNDCMIAT